MARETRANSWNAAAVAGHAPKGVTTTTVRVRFAPSPTGALHIGNVRAALFNYAFARHNGGAFVLRLDDTDDRRDVSGAAEAIYRDLRLLGLEWDEGPDVGGAFGPYVQSERTALYTRYLDDLLARGLTYPCYCTKQRVETLKSEQAARGEPPRYDRHCLTLSHSEFRALAGTPSVVRLRLPKETVHYTDLVFGALEYDLRHNEDPILRRSNGSILYDFASVVDDHTMRVSHILRGDSWLSTTPMHIAMFRALEWEPPEFAHLPQIVGPDRKKLAKREGARSLRSLLADGYVPEALQNALALLGWSPGTGQDVLAPAELIEHFGLDHVQRSPALFDMARLNWLNGMHIRTLSADDLFQRCLPYARAAGLVASAELDAEARTYLTQVLALSQDRLRLLSETPDLVWYFYREPTLNRALLLERGSSTAEAVALLRAAADTLATTDFVEPALEETMRTLARVNSCSTGRLFWLVRIAVTGRRAAPPLFAVLALLGRAAVLDRLRRAATALEQGDVPDLPDPVGTPPAP
ncbi:MAG TPA: glutamate--tRNA ligase [Ktedonobacterales bacterium]|nr:glutamate--tRNA ligase [Ktedonobacterales bacterium]